ncbi:kinetochore complex Sim4 subunit Fta1-domain-containing protein [Xylaria intraflava]|nr:kinetochore complex Sim4 subunit Fta1-domain-containing protein [Xylaria intraflava]
MPPRRRRRPAVESPQPDPAASDDNASDHTGDPDDSIAGPEEEEPGFRFFNTTFATFRVSPLYVGQQPLTAAGLETLSRRLRDTLVGDVVRGVQVGLENDTTLGRAGALNRVTWRECNMDRILPSLAEAAGSEQNRGGDRTRHLLCLELEYENVTFSALMLPSIDGGDGDSDDDESRRLRDPPSWTSGNTNTRNKNNDHDEDEDEDASGAFAHYPLLLTRLPAPLKIVLIDFLSSTFDCRISPLHLGTRTLIRSWERWIQESDPATVPAKKDIALTLAFDLEPPRAANHEQDAQPTPSQPGLKTLDITVPAPEIYRFLRAGRLLANPETNTHKRPGDQTITKDPPRQIKRRAGTKDEEGWTWREPPNANANPTSNLTSQPPDNPTFPQPFTEALARYLDHNLALDIFHPAVRVQRVLCDAFALSDGRMKVFAPTPASAAAVETFVRDLVRRAEGRAWGLGSLRLAELARRGVSGGG